MTKTDPDNLELVSLELMMQSASPRIGRVIHHLDR